jgi:hypothetical protein
MGYGWACDYLRSMYKLSINWQDWKQAYLWVLLWVKVGNGPQILNLEYPECFSSIKYGSWERLTAVQKGIHSFVNNHRIWWLIVEVPPRSQLLWSDLYECWILGTKLYPPPGNNEPSHIRQSAFVWLWSLPVFTVLAFSGKLIAYAMACQPRFLNFDCPGTADVYVSVRYVFPPRLNFAHSNVWSELSFVLPTGIVLGTFNDRQG